MEIYRFGSNACARFDLNPRPCKPSTLMLIATLKEPPVEPFKGTRNPTTVFSRQLPWDPRQSPWQRSAEAERRHASQERKRRKRAVAELCLHFSESMLPRVCAVGILDLNPKPLNRRSRAPLCWFYKLLGRAFVAAARSYYKVSLTAMTKRTP